MRKKLETYEDFINDKFYGSVIKILQISPKYNKVFKNGLTTGELRTLLQDGYKIEKGRVTFTLKLKEYIRKNHTDIRLNQEKSNSSSSNFTQKLDKLRDQIIEKNNNKWVLIEKYKLAFIKKWHEEQIATCSLENILPFPNMIYYFPSGGIGLYNNEITTDDLLKLHKISDDINKKFKEIQEIFYNIGIRKGIHHIIDIIEHLSCRDEIKLFFTCHVIVMNSLSNIVNPEEVIEYVKYIELMGHWSKNINKDDLRTSFNIMLDEVSEIGNWKLFIWEEFLKQAILKYIGIRFNMSDKDLNNLLTEYETLFYEDMSYKKIAMLAMLINNNTISNSINFIPICEQPHLFLSDRTRGFNADEICLLKQGKSVKDFYEANEKIKDITSKRIDLNMLIEDSDKRVKSQDYALDDFYQDFLENNDRKKLEYYLKQNIDTFSKSDFLNGYEKQLKKYNLTKEMLYTEMEKWATLFEAVYQIA